MSLSMKSSLKLILRLLLLLLMVLYVLSLHHPWPAQCSGIDLIFWSLRWFRLLGLGHCHGLESSTYIIHIYLTLCLSYLDPNFGRCPQIVPGVPVVQFIFRMSSSSIQFGKTIFTVCIFYQIASFDRSHKA